MHKRALPASRVTGRELIRNEHGAVWPLRSASDEDALRKLAHLFGSNIEIGNCCEAQRDLRSTSKAVVSLGKESSLAAQLYAHLTDRRLVIAADLDAVLAIPDVGVVVCTFPRVSDDLLEYLREPRSGDSVPGLICGSNEEDLYRQALLRSAALFLHAGASDANVVVVTASVQKRWSETDWTVYGTDSQPETTRRGLAAGAAMVVLDTHGDGIDALLGSELTLCAVKDRDELASADESPYCHLTGKCFRHKLPLETALNSNLLIGPSAIAGRMVVAAYCQGILSPKGFIDPRWSLLSRFLSQPAMGCFITCDQIIVVPTEALIALCRDLESGLTAGQAVTRFNRSQPAFDNGVRMTVFGDPDLTVAKSRPAHIHEGRPGTQRSIVTFDEVASGEATFLRAFLTNGLLSCRPAIQADAAEAINRVDIYQHYLVNGLETEGYESAPGPAMRQSALHFIAKKSTFAAYLEDWSALVGSSASSQACCAHCGDSIFCRAFLMRDSRMPPRRQLRSLRCNNIADICSDRGLRLVIKDNSLSIIGEWGRAPWDARVRFVSREIDEVEIVDWPSDSRGLPLRSMPVPENLPAVPLTVAVYIFERAAFNVVSAPFKVGVGWESACECAGDK